MKKPNIHIVHNSNNKAQKWLVKEEGTGKILSAHKTKDAADKSGTRQAKKNESECVIHNMDGKISEKNSYGNDPNPPKDQR